VLSNPVRVGSYTSRPVAPRPALQLVYRQIAYLPAKRNRVAPRANFGVGGWSWSLALPPGGRTEVFDATRVTISTSPAPRVAITLRSWDRSVLASLATSRNTFLAPAAFSAATCAATLWPSVQPYFMPDLWRYLLQWKRGLRLMA
jgi:hypothetical protein